LWLKTCINTNACRNRLLKDVQTTVAGHDADLKQAVTASLDKNIICWNILTSSPDEDAEQTEQVRLWLKFAGVNYVMPYPKFLTCNCVSLICRAW
jgi:hypothetical protein